MFNQLIVMLICLYYWIVLLFFFLFCSRTFYALYNGHMVNRIIHTNFGNFALVYVSKINLMPLIEQSLAI